MAPWPWRNQATLRPEEDGALEEAADLVAPEVEDLAAAESHGKTMGTPWENGDFIGETLGKPAENGDFMGS